MPAQGRIAVEATDEKYFGLKHMPGGIPLKDGKGEWPADHFTFRLIGEGSLREQAEAAPAPVEPAAVEAPAEPASAEPVYQPQPLFAHEAE